MSIQESHATPNEQNSVCPMAQACSPRPAGPTETTIQITQTPVELEASTVSLGGPEPNVHCYVVSVPSPRPGLGGDSTQPAGLVSGRHAARMEVAGMHVCALNT